MSYNATKSKDEEKKTHCMSLLEAYDAASASDRKNMVSAWLSSGGPKANLEGLVEQSMTHRQEAEGGNVSGMLTPGQISTLLGITSQMFGTAKEWAAALEAEIGENQKQFKQDEVLKINSGNFWTSKFRYKFVKARDEKSVAVLTQSWARRGEIGSSQKQIENVVDLVLKDDSESSSSKPASAAPGDPAVDVAGLRRAKRVNAQLDNLSASIGKAYGLLVRQPDQEQERVPQSNGGEAVCHVQHGCARHTLGHGRPQPMDRGDQRVVHEASGALPSSEAQASRAQEAQSW